MTRSQRVDARRRNPRPVYHAHRLGELSPRERAKLAAGLVGFLALLLVIVYALPILGGTPQ